jgi:hypothetical protein
MAQKSSIVGRPIEQALAIILVGAFTTLIVLGFHLRSESSYAIPSDDRSLTISMAGDTYYVPDAIYYAYYGSTVILFTIVGFAIALSIWRKRRSH